MLNDFRVGGGLIAFPVLVLRDPNSVPGVLIYRDHGTYYNRDDRLCLVNVVVNSAMVVVFRVGEEGDRDLSYCGDLILLHRRNARDLTIIFRGLRDRTLYVFLYERGPTGLGAIASHYELERGRTSGVSTSPT